MECIYIYSYIYPVKGFPLWYGWVHMRKIRGDTDTHKCKLKGTLCSDELQLGVLYPMLNQTHIRVYCGSDYLFLQ